MDKRVIIMLAVVGCVLAMLMACKGEEKKRIPGEPYYFKSFADYYHPFHPINETTREEAIKSNAYYMAYYDSQNRIISFTKYFAISGFVFGEKYFYYDSGELEHSEKLTDRNNVIIRYYGKWGRKILNEKRNAVTDDEFKRYIVAFEETKDKGDVSMLDRLK